ncbi:hypothetical protein [Qipengyuania sp.]|uniref:hypothetical protein n=1 Tax=Qipengyuania sp. TaxID=2004515 RepID=UPI0035C7BFB7
MILRRLVAADTTLSVVLHGLKVVVALLLNWIVLNLFAVADFVTWSVTSSILVVATASDLGIGQYTVTRLINTDRADWATEVSEGLSALLPLVLLAGLFVLVALDGPSTLYKTTMAILLAGRIVTIPFAAALNAANQFKIRKAIELIAYLLAVIAVGAIALTGSDIHWALLSLNATFLLGAGLTVLAASRYVPLRRGLAIAPPRKALEVFRAAVPFMANNLTGLLAYGGFIWLASLALDEVNLAKLAVLHGFVLVNLYQLYDVFLKARQADLVKPFWIRRYRMINWLVMGALPPAFVLFGRQALALIGNPVPIGMVEAILFGLFLACEMGNLFAQSVTQVNDQIAQRLKDYSALRVLLLMAFISPAMAPEDKHPLILLLTILSLISLGTFLYLLAGMAKIRSRCTDI